MLEKTSESQEKQSEEYQSFIENQTEIRACLKSPHYFLTKYAYILNRNTSKKVKWESWDYQLKLLDDFLNYNEIVILKARQLGISWLLAGYGLWKVLFTEGSKGLFLSQGEEEAWDMIAKSKFILDNLPPFLKMIQKHPDNRSLLDFTESDSKIVALPSTDKAGRSTDATFVIRDELARHPYGKENFSAIGPTIDAGGQLIDVSTIDKMASDNHFTERVNKAHNRESNAHFIFLGWKLRPVRQEGMSLKEWFDLRIKPKYSLLEIEQEYPETLDEAIKPSKTRAFFDVNATEDMLMHIMEPIRCDVDDFNGKVRIYKPPAIGEKYVVFTDPSDGKDDPFHTVVIHARTFEGVAEAHAKVPADMCAKIHDSLVRSYNNAYNDYEVNATAGGKFSETIKSLETPNVAPRRDANGNIMKDRSGKELKGWWTSHTIKKNMLWGLEEAIRNRLIISHNKDTINEFKGFIIPEGEDPRASRGLHDDAILAWAGAWQIRKYAPIGEAKFSSDHYKV